MKLKEEIRGNFKVEVYYQEDAECPCGNFDMTTKFLFGHGDYRSRDCLSSYCDYEEFTCNPSNCSQHDAVSSLIFQYVSGELLFKFLKETELIKYDKSAKLWESNSGEQYTKKQIIEKERFDDLLEYAELPEMVSLLQRYGEDIVISSFESYGYSQGDYVSGVMYVTKENYESIWGEYKNWKEEAKKCMDGELNILKHWFWNDVFGFVAYKKTRTVTSYPDVPERKEKENFIWEEIDSCWGFYEEPETVLNDAFRRIA